jgi:hypothetical protein
MREKYWLSKMAELDAQRKYHDLENFRHDSNQ